MTVKRLSTTFMALILILLMLPLAAAAQNGALDPVPPGRLLVGDDTGLYTMLADGSNITYLVREEAANCWLRDGQWSPDNTQVIYTRICGGFSPTDWHALGSDGLPDPNRTARVHRYDAATGSAEVLIRNDGSYQDYASDWHPDGDQIVIYSNRVEDRYAAYLYDLDTEETTPLASFESDLGRATFDPTGRYLLYNRYIVNPGELRWEVRVTDLNTGTEYAVAVGYTPHWSPDGQWIIYTTDAQVSREADVFVISAACIFEGGGCESAAAQNVTLTPAVAEREPMFSPDQSQIVYLRDTNESAATVTWDVIRQDLSTGRQQNLTNTISAKERLTGWEHVADVSRVDIAAALPVIGRVSTSSSSANLRAGASTQTDVVDIIPNGQIVYLEAQNNDGTWFRITRPDTGSSAWLYGNLLDVLAGDPEKLPVPGED